MGLLDIFRVTPPERSVTRRQVRDEPGPLTAHQARDMVWPIARGLDSAARLTLLTSGLDIGPDGRSFSWEFGFELPGRRAFALLGVEPSGEGADIDGDPIVLVQRIRPMSPTEADGLPTLPERFRDSPEVVAELAAQSVDFVAGPSDMKLEARVLPSGEAVWVTYHWDEPRMVPFTATVGQSLR